MILIGAVADSSADELLVGSIRQAANTLQNMNHSGEPSACKTSSSQPLSIPDEKQMINRCFSSERSLPTYLSAIQSSSEGVFDAGWALSAACSELDPTTEEGAEVEKLRRPGARLFGMINKFLPNAVSEIPTLITADLLHGNHELQELKMELSEIAKIEDRMERIKAVYTLVRIRQGSFAKNTPLANVLSTPGKTLRAAARTGKGGVCRDFAILLHWSLSQVQNSPTLSSQHERWGTLDENSFSVTQSYSPTHVWVEVRLPSRDSRGGTYFQRIDLDSTYYRQTFTPLFPRKHNLSTDVKRRLSGQCSRIRTCIADAAEMLERARREQWLRAERRSCLNN